MTYAICRNCWRVFPRTKMSYHRRDLCSYTCNHQVDRWTVEERKCFHADYVRMTKYLKESLR